MNLPGHSPYQVGVYVPEEKIVFTSDNVVVENIPFMHQAVPFEWLKSLKEYEKLDVDKVVPGHGRVVDKSCFRQMAATIQTFIDTVRAAIDKGMSLQEVQEKVTFEGLLPQIPRDERFSGVIQMNVTRLYELLKK